MKITNLSGYVLGCADYIFVRGDQWWQTNSPVQVFFNIGAARAELMKSQSSPIMRNKLEYTTIYRVHSDSINAFKINGNKIWTTDASKIIVDAGVYYKVPSRIADARLSFGARKSLPAYMTLTRER